jgi:hypothetical protein
LRLEYAYVHTAAWYETPNIYGSAAQEILPFRDSTLNIKSAINATIEGGSTALLKVHRENGIGAWCGFPFTSNEAHNLAECSNHSICDRSTGERQCFEPFTGASCDKCK